MSKFLVLALVLVFSVFVSATETTPYPVGYDRLKVTDPSVMEIVRYGIQEYNKRSTNHTYVLKKILRAGKVVHYLGYYDVNVILVETNCLKPVKENKLCFPEENAAEKEVVLNVATNEIGKDEVTEVTFV